MALTKAEQDERKGWAEELRVASTWNTGPRSRALNNLADRIDPSTKSPESPAEAAARVAEERAAEEEKAARDAEKAAQKAAKAAE